MKRYYYGFEYTCTLNTYSHEDHKSGKGQSIAGSLYCFKNEKELQEWISKEKKRIKVTIKQARRLHLGQSVNDFNEMLEHLRYCVDNNI